MAAAKKKKRKVKKLGPLSFDVDDGFGGSDDDDAMKSKKKKAKKSIKNPSVETDFLPDKEREQEEARERERLRAEWEAEQERIKSASLRDSMCMCVSLTLCMCECVSTLTTDENVTVTYSYWDGSGHRREITVRVVVARANRVCRSDNVGSAHGASVAGRIVALVDAEEDDDRQVLGTREAAARVGVC